MFSEARWSKGRKVGRLNSILYDDDEETHTINECHGC